MTVVSIVWIFRTQLRERIKDIVSFGMTGAVLHHPNQQSSEKPPTGLSTPTPNALPATHPMPTVQALIKKIEGQLSDEPRDSQVTKLVSALAVAQTESNFEFIWGLIFGSQITALRRLKEAGSISNDDAKRFYEDEVIPFNKDFKDVPYDTWSKFLFEQNLVTHVENNRLAITDLGRDFLMFVGERKRGFLKGL